MHLKKSEKNAFLCIYFYILTWPFLEDVDLLHIIFSYISLINRLWRGGFLKVFLFSIYIFFLSFFSKLHWRGAMLGRVLLKEETHFLLWQTTAWTRVRRPGLHLSVVIFHNVCWWIIDAGETVKPRPEQHPTCWKWPVLASRGCQEKCFNETKLEVIRTVNYIYGDRNWRTVWK